MVSCLAYIFCTFALTEINFIKSQKIHYFSCHINYMFFSFSNIPLKLLTKTLRRLLFCAYTRIIPNSNDLVMNFI